MKKIKNGYYTEYLEAEYRIAREDKYVFFISEDSKDLEKGFRLLPNPYDSRVLYEKKLTLWK